MPVDLGRGVKLYTREECRLRPPRKVIRLARAHVGGKTAHYSTGEELGRDDPFEWWREIQRFHMGPQRGWWDVGYNFGIPKEGIVLEGRGLLVRGGHAGTNAGNLTTGVCFLGDDDPGQDVTDEARLAFVALDEWHTRQLGRRTAWFGHRDWKSTACPGDELYEFVKGGLKLDKAPPPPAPPPTGKDPIMAKLPLLKKGPGDKVGSRGKAVSNVQAMLRDVHRIRARGKLIAVDGAFGPQTHDGVREYQGKVGAAVDGIVGPETWGKLLLG